MGRSGGGQVRAHRDAPVAPGQVCASPPAGGGSGFCGALSEGSVPAPPGWALSPGPAGSGAAPGPSRLWGPPRTPPPDSSARSLGAERPAVPAQWRHREPSFLPGHLQVNTEIGICSLPPLNKPICGGGGRRWERLGLRRFSPCELFPFEAENSPLGTARGQRSSCPGGGRGCSPGLRGCGGLGSP